MNIDDKLKMLSEGGIPSSSNNETLLAEAYFGKNDVLLQCEALLDKALKTSSTGNSEIKQVEVLLQKLFNFNRLVLIPYAGTLGATIPASSLSFESIFMQPKMEKSKNGGVQFRSADKVNATILIDLGVSSKLQFTGAELLGIIMHEIGHSMRVLLPSSRLKSTLFAASMVTNIITKLRLFSQLDSIQYKPKDIEADIRKEKLKFIGSLAANFGFIYGVEIVGSVNDKINMFIDKYFGEQYRETSMLFSISQDMIVFIKKHKNLIKRFVDAYKGNKLIQWLRNPVFNKFMLIKNSLSDPITAINTISNISMNYLTMREETFSDYIATIYGYGPETQSALHKYHTYQKTYLFDNPLSRFLKLPYNILSAIMDPHPSNITRIQLTIDNLEIELSKEINKQHFNIIKADLDNAKKVLEDVKKSVEKSKFLNFDIIIYRKIMNKLIKGHDDFRALFFNLRPKDLRKLEGLVELPYHTKDPDSLNESVTILNESFNIHSDNNVKRVYSYLLSEAFDTDLNDMIEYWKE